MHAFRAAMKSHCVNDVQINSPHVPMIKTKLTFKKVQRQQNYTHTKRSNYFIQASYFIFPDNQIIQLYGFNN